jgi:hypothetical protein
MSSPWHGLTERKRNKLIRALVTLGPFGLPVATRFTPWAGTGAARDGIAIVDGALFATADANHWVCNAPAAAIAMLADDGPNLHAELEALYGTPIDPAMVEAGRARLVAVGLLVEEHPAETR